MWRSVFGSVGAEDLVWWRGVQRVECCGGVCRGLGVVEGFAEGWVWWRGVQRVGCCGGVCRGLGVVEGCAEG